MSFLLLLLISLLLLNYKSTSDRAAKLGTGKGDHCYLFYVEKNFETQRTVLPQQCHCYCRLSFFFVLFLCISEFSL